MLAGTQGSTLRPGRTPTTHVSRIGGCSADAVADLADHDTAGHELAADAPAAGRVAADPGAPVAVAVRVAGAGVGDPAGVRGAVAVVECDALRRPRRDGAVPAAGGRVDAGAGAEDREAVLAGRDGDTADPHLARVEAPGRAGGGRRSGGGDDDGAGRGDDEAQHHGQGEGNPPQAGETLEHSSSLVVRIVGSGG
jgi:hypothetical protein